MTCLVSQHHMHRANVPPPCVNPPAPHPPPCYAPPCYSSLQMVHPVYVDSRTGQILQAAGQPTMMTFHQVGEVTQEGGLEGWVILV